MSSVFSLAFGSKARIAKEKEVLEEIKKEREKERIKNERIEKEKIEKERINLSLEELLQRYRTIYPDIQKRFPNININFIKNNYNNKTKLFNINIKKLNYKDYIAYKLLKILLKFKIQENTRLKMLLKIEKQGNTLFKKNKFILNEQYISDTYNLENKYHSIYLEKILNLEKTIFEFINFIKDIDDKAFMDNINIKWNMLQHTIKNNLKPQYNTSPKSISPKRSPKSISPKSISPKSISPKRSPKSISPKRSPKSISPMISPKSISPKRSPKSKSPMRSPKSISPKSISPKRSPKSISPMKSPKLHPFYLL